jgi:hypothetical protein
LQAFGRLGQERGKQDLDIHLLKPERFAIDAGYAIPPSESSGNVLDDRQDHQTDPVEEYLTHIALYIQSCDGCQQNLLSG